jgi:GTPase SAR1 family protein
VSTSTILLSCVRSLKQRHEHVLNEAGSEANQDVADNLASLRVAECSLEKSRLVAKQPGLPIQIAVIGPTQAGKSTVVNLIFGQDVAKVSPMAGFTVHPQGFTRMDPGIAADGLAAFFEGYRRVGTKDLPTDRYGFFSLETVPSPSMPGAMNHAVLWDTPDFDSVSAHGYVNSVLRTIALADAVILVVSRDKYADQSVWDTMKLIEPLQQPTVVCLNKIDWEAGPALVRSLTERWRESRQDGTPAIVALPYAGAADDDAGEDLRAQRSQLVEAVERAVAADYRSRIDTLQLAFVRRHWGEWTAPVRREQQALDAWNAAIESYMDEALAIYRRDYLDHPQHYETFQRALAELLTLLELPGVGAAMLMARKLVTWPIRQLGRLGKADRRKAGGDQESLILAGIVDHALIRANELALAKSEDSRAQRVWWHEVASEIRGWRFRGRGEAAHAVARYQQGFQPQVEGTARQLLEGLKEHPAALNSLRAARFTTDAIALAMALHSGGIGVQDFVIAPAILAVTSLMAEGVLGRFMLRAEQDLKRQQLLAVENLLRETFGDVLKAMPRSVALDRRFNIPADMLVEVEKLWV